MRIFFGILYIIVVFGTTELFFYSSKYLISGFIPLMQKITLIGTSGFILGVILTTTFILSNVRNELNRVIEEYNEIINQEKPEPIPLSDARKIYVDISTQFWKEASVNSKMKEVLPKIFIILAIIKCSFLLNNIIGLNLGTQLFTIVSAIKSAAIVWVIVFLIYPGND